MCLSSGSVRGRLIRDARRARDLARRGSAAAPCRPRGGARPAQIVLRERTMSATRTWTSPEDRLRARPGCGVPAPAQSGDWGRASGRTGPARGRRSSTLRLAGASKVWAPRLEGCRGAREEARREGHRGLFERHTRGGVDARADPGPASPTAIADAWEPRGLLAYSAAWSINAHAADDSPVVRVLTQPTDEPYHGRRAAHSAGGGCLALTASDKRR